VGGGPGDPELLTLRAEALLAAAALVVVDESLVALAAAQAPGARLVVLADAADDPADDPSDSDRRDLGVGALLAAVGEAPGPIVRLYRGDPWLHPSYATESAALREAEVATESVAGVATEVALPARAGIPLHARQLAVTATFARPGAAPLPGDPSHTLVVTTSDVTSAAQRLTAAAGVAADADVLPAAALTTTGVRRGSLAELAELAGRGEQGGGPGLLVCGAVCAPGRRGARSG
jgi:siroheme synthase